MDNTQEQTVALVTGATGAIGWAIAHELARRPSFSVVVVARDSNKAEKIVSAIQHETGNPHVRAEKADLSRRADIESLAARWSGPLHVLINNAAATPRARQETPEGIETQFATNVLGYFWMIQAFRSVMSRSAPARIINVASYWAGDLDLDDLQFGRRRYDNNRAYRQSKQANRMLTVAFARRLEVDGITVNACHPGDVNSTLSNNLGFGGHESPKQGAATPVWLATEPIGGQVTGKYFEHLREADCRFSKDAAAIEALYQKCQEF